MRWLAAIGPLLLLVAPVAGDDAATRADAVRKALPAPAKAHGVTFEGDITVKGLWAGEVSFSCVPHTFAREAVWRVTETFFLDHNGVEQRVTLRYMMSPDLSLRSGAGEGAVEDAKFSAVFSPTKTGLQAIRTATAADGTSKSETLAVTSPPHACFGSAALLLLLRALPDDFSQSVVVPWMPLPDIVMGAAKTTIRTRQLRVVPVPQDAQPPDAWRVRVEDGDKAWQIDLSSDRTTLRRQEGPAFSIVPRGEGGVRVALDEEAPAATWQQAFLKFGTGYHMAKEALLRAAFHWPTMFKHETEVTKSWTGPNDLDKFRDAWIAEFMRQSLRRSREDTRRLLNMTLASGKVTKQTDDEVVFAAHANFGGGTQRTYTLRRVDGVWCIVFVKF